MDNINGVLLVDKPKGITSQTLITKIKRHLNIKKIGHAGTLDPLATGLMVVLLGSSTKLSDYLMSNEKEYECEILIGSSSDTEDIEGNIITEKEYYDSLLLPLKYGAVSMAQKTGATIVPYAITGNYRFSKNKLKIS